LICKAIDEYRSLTRKDIDELLWTNLPDWMDDAQKKTKVNNLISEARRNGKITNKGSLGKPQWVLIN
jgi:ATP-dependent DNA helicase RecG